MVFIISFAKVRKVERNAKEKREKKEYPAILGGIFCCPDYLFIQKDATNFRLLARLPSKTQLLT
jgi:hypothetical protein